MGLKSERWRRTRVIVLYLAPAVLIYGLLFLYPTIDALRISLYEYGINPANAKFIGLGNFVELIGDRMAHLALRNNMIIMAIGGFLMLSIALFFAAALTNRRIKGKSFFRTVIFFPYMISAAGVGLFWTFVLNPSIGLLNGFLRAVGLGVLARPWLGEAGPAMGAIIFVLIWWGIGFYLLFLIAGIESIPVDLLDAARVDGASERDVFLKVTLPLLWDHMAVAITLWIIDALNVFATVMMLTKGGPAYKTHTLSTYMAAVAFKMGGGTGVPLLRFGYGTAISVALTLLVCMASGAYFMLRRREAIEF